MSHITGHVLATLHLRPHGTPFREFARRLLSVRMASFAVAFIILFALVAILADVLAPRNPVAHNLSNVLQGPSTDHFLGTDDLGRDVLSRLMHGSRVSLTVGLLANLLALLIGVPLGLVAGFSRNFLDNLIMRTLDGILSFPAIVLAIAISAFLGPNLGNVIIAISIVSVPYIARLTRGETLTVREREFVLAAATIGASNRRIMFRHVLPNTMAPIIVQSSLNVAFAIIAEASLSFLGVGISPPQPSWGNMIQTGYRFVEVAPWLVLAPGVAIFVAVISFNFLGDALREALDPRFRR